MRRRCSWACSPRVVNERQNKLAWTKLFKSHTIIRTLLYIYYHTPYNIRKASVIKTSHTTGASRV